MSKKLAVPLMAGVATIIILLVSGCSSNSSAPAPSPSKVSTTPVVAGPMELFPQEGYTPYLVKGTGGVLSCDKSGTTARLTIGGTVTLDGTNITVTRSKLGMTVSFQGTPLTVSAIVNKTIPVNVPEDAKDPAGFYLATKNFANAGITSLTLCGRYMPN
ncbi:MAG: hypothetical protein ABIQ04_02355 [Candidatus Saccharimonadales bacterium]